LLYSMEACMVESAFRAGLKPPETAT